MHSFGRKAHAILWLAAGISVRSAEACSCAPPPPPPAGTQPAIRFPSLRGKGTAVFVGVVEDVYPEDISDYQARWRQIYGEDLSEDSPPSLAQLRGFALWLWSELFSRSERERIGSAKSLDDLESAVHPFWLTPRRVRFRIEELFAGPQAGQFVLYTGAGEGDCGVDFKAGGQWLVDAYLDTAGRWIAHLCSATAPISEANAVLNKLRAERR
jgi:hypothetical protein